MRAYRSKSNTIYKRRSFINASFIHWRIILDENSKSFGGTCPAIHCLPCWLACRRRCSCIIELVCLQHSFLLCNVTFFYSFSKIIEKTKKIKYTPKRGREKYFLCIGNIMSHPWIKHICPFVRQTLGFNTTLGSCSRYIDLCPPPFGYSSKHMESLHCLLPRKLTLMPCYLSLIICRAIVQGKVLPSLSQPLYSLSLSLIPSHPEHPIKSLFKINEAFSLIIKIL
jgi:hypothetical protein